MTTPLQKALSAARNNLKYFEDENFPRPEIDECEIDLCVKDGLTYADLRVLVEAVPVWRDIKSAPRDMSEILLYIPSMEFTKTTMGRVSQDGTVWRMYEDRPDAYGSWSTDQATHWMPIFQPEGALS